MRALCFEWSRLADTGSVGSSREWTNTTHDWSRSVDVVHLATIRADPAAFAPTGVLHLIFEVVAYAAEEAMDNGNGRCTIVLHADDSISVADNGRGTDTRWDAAGSAVRKPVMSTKDLRFFDSPLAPMLPDDWPRRGMSVVAALSEWLAHTNRRLGASWVQRYERGVPVTDLQRISDDGTHGTTVHFRPAADLDRTELVTASDLRDLTSSWRELRVDVTDRRSRPA